jgi:hypothetical protein
MIRNRQHVLALGAALAVSLLAGCGTSPMESQIILTQRQHVAKSASAPTLVNHQAGVINIVAPADDKGTGAIAMNFKFPAHTGYSVMATAADIDKIQVDLKTRSFLLTKTVATATVTKAQIVNNMAAVQFTGLAGGTYTVDISALDASGANIGSDSESVPVTEGQTATVNSQLKLVSTPSAGATGLGVNISIVNGN